MKSLTNFRKYSILLVLAMIATPLASFAEEPGYEKNKGPQGPMRLLQEADTNKDGTLSRTEFLAGHQKFAEKRFEMLDADKNGEVSQDEIKVMREKRRKKMQERRAQRRAERELHSHSD